MALISSNPDVNIRGIHLVCSADLLPGKTNPRGAVLAPGRCATTFPWLQEAFKRCPIEEGETLFVWASRVERTKVITFEQAYLLRNDYSSYFFAYIKEA